MAMEGELANGLIVGHAYSVTDVKTVCIYIINTAENRCHIGLLLC